MEIDTWPNGILKYCHFCVGPIDFQLGLPLNNTNENDGQNKFEEHISKNLAKMANFRPLIGQDASFAQTLNGYILVIFIRF